MSKLTFEQIVESWAKKSTPTPKKAVEAKPAPAPTPPPPATKVEKKPAKVEKTPQIEKSVEVVTEAPVEEDLNPEVTNKPYKSGVFKCGHLNWMVSDENDELHKGAVELGFCCHEFRRASESVNLTGHQRRPYLEIRWDVKGLWHPIPDRLRRSPERENSLGWPGYCSDPDTGLYIGGIGNDCRHNKGALKKCIVHSVKPKKEEDPRDIDSEVPITESQKVKKNKKK